MSAYLNSFIIRVSAILLIAVFFFYSCGFHFYYQIRLGQIKEKNTISAIDINSHPDLISIEAPLDEIVWLDDHEISWNGNMYDVTQIEISNNVFKALGFYDAEEEELKDKYENSEQNDERAPSSQKVKTAESFLQSAILISHFLSGDDLKFEFPKIIRSSGYPDQFFTPPKA